MKKKNSWLTLNGNFFLHADYYLFIFLYFRIEINFFQLKKQKKTKNLLLIIRGIKEEDIDISASNSSNVSFNETQIPAIEITNPIEIPTLQSVNSIDDVDDIDEDEAFINELMALHPNDEDIIVEDIESLDVAIASTNIPSADNDNDDNDGVRKIRIVLVVFL